ncbi:hypothetical protein BT67DRAFT_444537 [Trichocladium antarcticum]|uniref:Uncharacterized protein n=1 Tax=Trichocladium antarcticum TaxID=1450529 RepID=A0AAN6UFI1_9PEZI|nr:hypothetical protein BT67DRAFT_444537 [Trichocladium antarcticum]
MCRVTHYRDFHCGHRWAAISAPCCPGLGFNTCPDFVTGRAKPLPPRLVALAAPCPTWYVHVLCGLVRCYTRASRPPGWMFLTDGAGIVISRGCMTATRRAW